MISAAIERNDYGRETVRGTATSNCCGVLDNPLVWPMSDEIMPTTRHSLPTTIPALLVRALLVLMLAGCSLEDPPAPCANPRAVWMLDYGTAGFLNSPKRKWKEVQICEQ